MTYVSFRPGGFTYGINSFCVKIASPAAGLLHRVVMGDSDGRRSRGRSRGRSRSRTERRSRSRSRSRSSSSYSSDSEEREERDCQRESRREAREEKAREEKAAHKARRERAAAAAQAEREQEEAVRRLGQASWRFVAAGDEDEDCFSLRIRGKKPESLGFLGAGVDCTSWQPLHDYLRLEDNFNVTNEKDKLLLKAKLEARSTARVGSSRACVMPPRWAPSGRMHGHGCARCQGAGEWPPMPQATLRAYISSPSLEPTARALHARRRSP
jgi:hypothetical protein